MGCGISGDPAVPCPHQLFNFTVKRPSRAIAVPKSIIPREVLPAFKVATIPQRKGSYVPPLYGFQGRYVQRRMEPVITGLLG